MTVRCIRCRILFEWSRPKGGPPKRCPACTRLRRNKLERAGVKRRGARDWSADWARRKARAAAKQALAGLTQPPGGGAPFGYLPRVETVKCVHCRKAVATMRRGVRGCCLDCKAKGLR